MSQTVLQLQDGGDGAVLVLRLHVLHRRDGRICGALPRLLSTTARAPSHILLQETGGARHPATEMEMTILLPLNGSLLACCF